MKKMKFILAAAFFAAAGLASRAASSPDAGTIDLHVKPERLAEWNDWRFGLFIHWGPWSQTGIGNIWQITKDPEGTREKRFELWKTFNPEKFDPKKWARAAKEAGMKYVVFVAKHHDGFSNYDTALSPYKITSPEVPFSKNPNADITRAVIDAFRAEGLAIGLYYSHIDWHHPDGKYFSQGCWAYDKNRVKSDPASWQRFADYETGQIRELLTNYGKIDILWFDIRWPFAGSGMERSTNERVRASILQLLRTMKTLQPDIIFNDRGLDVYGGFQTPEQLVPAAGMPGSWETCLTITNGRGFWFKGDQVTAKPPAELVRTLVDVASKGGNFLLNVGPRPDGELSPGEYEALAGIGAWMRVNGEAVYGTTRSLFPDLPWSGRSTTKGRTVYLHVFDWPKDGVLALPGLVTPIRKAWLMADPERTPLALVTRDGEPAISAGPGPGGALPTVVAVEFATDPAVDNAVRASAGGSIDLTAARASIKSATASYNQGRSVQRGDFIEGIESPADRLSWNASVRKGGRFRVAIQYAVQTGQAGSAFQVTFDGASPLVAKTRATATWNGPLLGVRSKDKQSVTLFDNLWTFKTLDLGVVELPAGVHAVTLAPRTIAGKYLMYFKTMTLTPLD